MQKLGVTHDIKDYLLVMYNSNKNSGYLGFVRYIGENEYVNVVSNDKVLDNQIIYYKHLTDYVKEEKRYITDHRAKALIKPFYVQFSNEYFKYLQTQEDVKPEKELQPLPFMC